MSFQSHMSFFLLLNTKDGILNIVCSLLFHITRADGELHCQQKNLSNVTFALMALQDIL